MTQLVDALLDLNSDRELTELVNALWTNWRGVGEGRYVVLSGPLYFQTPLARGRNSSVGRALD